MKRLIITIALASFTFYGFSQENKVNITGGYAWLNANDNDYNNSENDIKTSGWRITGTYEYNPNEGKVAYGFSMGYIDMSGSYNGTADSLYTANYSVSSIPLYFAPKFLFGNDRVKGFIKLTIGGIRTNFERTGTGTTTVSGTGYGFYGGGGAGLEIAVSESVYIIGEYEIAYVSSSYYSGSLLQSASGGIGIRF